MNRQPSFVLVAVVSLVLAAMAGLGLGALRAADTPTSLTAGGATPAPTTPTPSPIRTTAGSQIALQGDKSRAAAGERINLTGTAGSPGVALVVQERDNGAWVDFPARGTTRSDGSFTSYVLFGRSGQHVLRMSAPGSGRVSNPVTVTVV